MEIDVAAGAEVLATAGAPTVPSAVATSAVTTAPTSVAVRDVRFIA